LERGKKLDVRHRALFAVGIVWYCAQKQFAPPRPLGDLLMMSQATKSTIKGAADVVADTAEAGRQKVHQEL